jgi:hypothetical protein
MEQDTEVDQRPVHHRHSQSYPTRRPTNSGSGAGVPRAKGHLAAHDFRAAVLREGVEGATVGRS